MKKMKYLLLTMLCIAVTGCGNKTVDSGIGVENEEVREGNSLENNEIIINATDSVAATDNADTTELIEPADVTGVPDITEPEELLTEHISIDLSAARETYAEGDAVTPFKLKVIEKENNGIDWAYDWYDSKNLSLPMIGDDWNQFYDDVYEYQWKFDELEIYEKETGACLYILDYPTDKWYVNGNNAYVKDGIFYGGSVANGYAQPDTCFMFAYDLINDKLLWRSADQSYNTMNFVVKGDIIICGYGFTSEKDYLYQINRNTGEIIDRMELASKPDLLVEQDGKLYVHTYNCNYVLEMDFTFDYSEDIKKDVDDVVSSSESLQKELENMEKIIQKYTPLAEAAQTQSEMNLSSRCFFLIWDTELNNLWSRFSNSADPQTKEKVLAEQRNWIAMKEEVTLLNLGSVEENGSMYPLLQNAFLEEITKNRAYVLANELAKIKGEAFVMPEISTKYGVFVDNQGTGDIYSSLITRQGWEGNDEAIISIYRLGETEGTFVDNGNGELTFTSNDGSVKGIIKISGWDGASFEVTETSEMSVFTVGEKFIFPFVF